jgi:hypothetical protein
VKLATVRCASFIKGEVFFVGYDNDAGQCISLCESFHASLLLVASVLLYGTVCLTSRDAKAGEPQQSSRSRESVLGQCWTSQPSFRAVALVAVARRERPPVPFADGEAPEGHRQTQVIVLPPVQIFSRYRSATAQIDPGYTVTDRPPVETGSGDPVTE